MFAKPIVRLSPMLWAMVLCGGNFAVSDCAFAQESAPSPSEAAGATPQDRISSLVGIMIWQIGQEHSPDARRARADSLALVFKSLSIEGKLSSVLNDSKIDALAEYLKDENVHSVREVLGVVDALGTSGPRAERAVPVLEAAYARACAAMPLVRTGIHDVDYFEQTIGAITGHEPSCY